MERVLPANCTHRFRNGINYWINSLIIREHVCVSFERFKWTRMSLTLPRELERGNWADIKIEISLCRRLVVKC